MGIYLVMKNNLIRNFLQKSTYLFLIVIPILISIVGMVPNISINKTLRIGILASNDAAYEQMADKLSQYHDIQFERADERTVHTDIIMNQYHYVMDAAKKDSYQNVLEKIEKNEPPNLTHTERIGALLMMAYMIIATVYASKMIKDKNDFTMERFLYSGGTKLYYLLGYVFSTGIIILIQVVAATTFLRVFDQDFSLSLLKMWGLIFIITIFTTIFGSVLSFLSKKDMNANIIASSLAVIFSLIGGTFVPVSSMPQFLQIVSIISPVRWMIQFIS